MKKIYTICVALLITVFAGVDMLHAQDAEPTEVKVRDLHSYEIELSSQDDLRLHPLAVLVSGQTPADKYVTFKAMVTSYPKNSGLATPNQNTGIPGRIHVFVIDVNALIDGPEGMSIQIVVDGVRRETLEDLTVGDVIEVAGFLRFFNNVSQFDATDVTFIGNARDDEEYSGMLQFLEPTVVDLNEINTVSSDEGRFKWNSENYSTYINKYVKLEGLEVVDVQVANTGRPRLVLSNGETRIIMYDTSLRYRNDRITYGVNPTTEEGLGYNYRRRDIDGPFVPPAPGSIVDISGYLLVDTFDFLGLNESASQSTLKIAPWDDGVLWIQDGTDTDFRITEGINNDLVVKGFPALIDNIRFDVEAVTSADEATLSADILLPENDYTLNSVSITYNTSIYTSDESSDNVTAEMTGSGDTYSFTFDSFADFTVVNYTITAVTTTPDGIETTGRLSGSFDVVNDGVTSPVVFSPAAGTYENIVEVELSTPTEGATIYYTTDGSEPTTASTEYTGAISLTETATVRAIAKSAELDASPVNSRTYTVVATATEVATLAELRESPRDGTVYQYTGNAVVTFTRNSRNAKYLMDSTGGMLIDDTAGVITSTYEQGDVMTGLTGTLDFFNGVQIVPSLNPGDPTGTAEIVPFELTLNEIVFEEHQAALIKVNNVRFVNPPAATFANGVDYRITDDSMPEGETFVFRTNFSEVTDIAGQPIPEGPVNITGLLGSYSSVMQLMPRSYADFNFDVSNERFDGAYEFQLAQNYPNPFNPSTSISYSVAEMTNVTLTVYDILGRVVATLVNDVHSPGQYNVNFDAARLSSGTYIYRIEAGDFMSTKKMLLIK